MKLPRPTELIVAALLVLGTSVAAADEIKIQHGGLTLNARLSLADGKKLTDGVVLMVHGTLAHNAMDTIANLAGVLAERGISSLAVNLSLGVDDRHGMYDCTVTHRHRHLDALPEIEAWLDWLKSEGAGSVVLFGHSRGGNQAARFAAGRSHPSLQRLVLLAPATWNAMRAAAGFENRHGRPLAGAFDRANRLSEAGRGGEVLAKHGLLYCPGADVTAESFVSYYRADPQFDTPAVLKDVKVPTLVVAGGKDTVVKGLPEAVKPLADGKNLAFAVIDDAGHFFLDLFAEDVADLIEEFLAAGS